MLVLALLLGVACSPEASRVRGSGPGADPGNRGAVVDIHGDTNPTFDTPQRGEAIKRSR